ncbi:chromosome partition smc domain protein [Mycobacteroides abscessus]|nr:chromosome partition smc domain protein [Mycobacteroides abscessus]
MAIDNDEIERSWCSSSPTLALIEFGHPRFDGVELGLSRLAAHRRLNDRLGQPLRLTVNGFSRVRMVSTWPVSPARPPDDPASAATAGTASRNGGRRGSRADRREGWPGSPQVDTMRTGWNPLTVKRSG